MTDQPTACTLASRTTQSVAEKELIGAEPQIVSAQVVDVGDCDRFEFVVGLHKHQREAAGLGHMMESWPLDVRSLVNGAMTDWTKRNSDRAIRCVTTAVANGACAVILHHAKRK